VTSSSVDLVEPYTAIFDDVATQMRSFYDSNDSNDPILNSHPVAVNCLCGR
jgi:hypothetical protein